MLGPVQVQVRCFWTYRDQKFLFSLQFPHRCLLSAKGQLLSGQPQGSEYGQAGQGTHPRHHHDNVQLSLLPFLQVCQCSLPSSATSWAFRKGPWEGKLHLRGDVNQEGDTLATLEEGLAARGG